MAQFKTGGFSAESNINNQRRQKVAVALLAPQPKEVFPFPI
jgi:hypothetical protein